jgi:guanylate kinase
MKDMTLKPNGVVVAIAGPSGVSKNSIIEGVMKRCTNCADLITATTREARTDEKHGVDYFFLSPSEFDEELKKGNIPEVNVHPNGARYGTFLPYLNDQLKKGRVVMGDITISGARYYKDAHNALTIFIMPPSFGALEKRIKNRKAHMPREELEKRLTLAKKEIEEESSWYDYRVVNEDNELDDAVNNVIEILKKEGYSIT